jgi:flagellar basal body-associated protein FliL
MMADKSDSEQASGAGAPSEAISLDDLVASASSVAGAPTPARKDSAASATSPAGATVAAAVVAPDELGDIDSFLAVEDPAFAASLSELKTLNLSVPSQSTIDPLDLGEDLGPLQPGERAGLRSIVTDYCRRTIEGTIALAVYIAKDGRKNFLRRSLELLKTSLQQARAWATHLSHLPRVSKLLLFGVLLLAACLVAVVRVTLHGSFLPDFHPTFLSSFGPVANRSFTYEADAPMEELQNPLLHPESVVLIDRIVVNLKHQGSSSSSANPMGMFEFYVETASRDAAVELKVRDIEAKDLISRTLEQMVYEELITDPGKLKLKIILRKNLNELLTKGRVRKVYFKTVVLKP